MCMSTMERRLQILLDQARYARVAAEAARSGRSVAAVIRDAIDFRFPAGDDDRVVALSSLLRMTEAPRGASEEWSEIKAAIEAGS